jgi:ribosome-binding factor A
MIRDKRGRDPDAGYRHERLERVVQDELNEILRDEVTDPSLADVRVTHVKLSVDYRAAKVYYTCASGAAIDRALAPALARAAGFMRARLADTVELKRVPELRFTPF